MKIIKNQWKSMRINGNSLVLLGFHEKVLPSKRFAGPQGAASAAPDIPSHACTDSSIV